MFNELKPNSAELACHLISLGYSIFPAGRDKKPHNGYKWKDHPINQLAEASQRWNHGNKNAAVGVITGKISNLLVLDIDNKNGSNGSKTLEKLENEYGRLPETFKVKTPSGGYHYYFNYNDCGLTTDANVRDGVDYRGEGGYVVSPNSLTKAGLYEVVYDTEVVDAPEWLVEILRGDKSKRSKKEKRSSTNTQVEVGGRNNYLTSAAGRKWNEGVSYDELLHYLLDLNASFPVPLCEKEVESIAQSVSRYPRFDFSICTNEQDFSDYIADKFSEGIKYVPAIGFHLADNEIWVQDKEGLSIQQCIKDVVKNACEVLDAIADRAQTEKQRGTIKALQQRIKRRAFQNNSIEMIKSHPDILLPIKKMDFYCQMIGMENGVFDLDNREIIKNGRDKFVSKTLNAEYDPNASSPVFDAFIERLFPELDERSYVMKALAYALSGEADLHQFFIMVGSGANGKSTLMELMACIFGTYSVALNPNSLIRKASEGVNNDIAPLRGARLCLTSETPNGAVLDVALIKRLVGGDTIATRFLYQEYFEFVNKAVIFMLTNFMPVFDGGDLGFKRRVRIIPFDVVIPEEERDAKLLSKMKGEAAGILNRLLDAYDLYREEGLKMPPKFKDATQHFCDQSDLIKQFFDDELEYNNESFLTVSRVYDMYKRWATERLYKPMAQNTFSNMFEMHTKLERERVNQGRVWKGINVRCSSMLS